MATLFIACQQVIDLSSTCSSITEESRYLWTALTCHAISLPGARVRSAGLQQGARTSLGGWCLQQLASEASTNSLKLYFQQWSGDFMSLSFTEGKLSPSLSYEQEFHKVSQSSWDVITRYYFVSLCLGHPWAQQDWEQFPVNCSFLSLAPKWEPCWWIRSSVWIALIQTVLEMM